MAFQWDLRGLRKISLESKKVWLSIKKDAGSRQIPVSSTHLLRTDDFGNMLQHRNILKAAPHKFTNFGT